MTTTHMILRYVHITGGTLALVSGALAVTFQKGSVAHRRSGNLFFVSILTLGVAGVILSLIKTPINMGNAMGGSVVIYMVATAWATVIRPPGKVGAAEVGLALLGLAGTITATTFGVMATNAANGRFAGYPPLLYWIFAGIAGLATLLDARMILRGGLTGAARTTRHLWRMSFAFYGATGSFFFGQPKFVPDWMKETKLFIVFGLLPLILMLYFLVKVRVWPMLKATRRRLAATPRLDSVSS